MIQLTQGPETMRRLVEFDGEGECAVTSNARGSFQVAREDADWLTWSRSCMHNKREQLHVDGNTHNNARAPHPDPQQLPATTAAS
tara:strand:+ start:14204 stop:14458 length:255 start_codon:yes stop_codon:yes gene_type:complete